MDELAARRRKLLARRFSAVWVQQLGRWLRVLHFFSGSDRGRAA